MFNISSIKFFVFRSLKVDLAESRSAEYNYMFVLSPFSDVSLPGTQRVPPRLNYFYFSRWLAGLAGGLGNREGVGGWIPCGDLLSRRST